MITKTNAMLLLASISLMTIQDCVMAENPEIDKTFQLLDEGDKAIELREEYKNITFLFGNTGSGKTTFLQWISGDNHKLISKETSEGSGEFIIEDGNRIGSSVMSKTLFPELVIGDTNAAFYDCPGFSDTRSTAHDIASTYFIKKVTDHSENVKIILTVSSPSVRPGGDRQDFLLLMRHVTSLVKNIDRYRDSIAVVVTKVDNRYVRKGRSWVLVPDKNVTRSVAEFFKTVQKTLTEKLKDVPSTEVSFIRNTLTLLDILLTENNGSYSRIMIFRRPDEPGPITDIDILQEGKLGVRHVLHNELRYAKKDKDDFGYTISDASKNVVNILVEKINDNVWVQVSEVVEKLQNHYKNVFYDTSTKIKSFLDSGVVEADERTARGLNSTFRSGAEQISLLILDSKNLSNIAELSYAIDRRVSQIDTKVNVENIKQQGVYFAFLQLVSSRTLPCRPWWSLLEKIESSFQVLMETLQMDVDASGTKLLDLAEGDVSQLVEKVEGYYKSLFEKMYQTVDSFVENTPPDESEARSFNDAVDNGISVISKLASETMNAKLSRFSNVVRMQITRLGITSCGSNIDHIVVYGKYADFLEILSGRTLTSKTWGSFFERIGSYLVSAKKSFTEKTFRLSSLASERNTKHMENIGRIIEEYYEEKMLSTGIEDIPDVLSEGVDTVYSWVNYACRTPQGRRFRNVRDKIENSQLSTAIYEDTVSFENNGAFLNFLRVFNSYDVSICDWMGTLQKTANKLDGSKPFMKFLRELYGKFSEYEVQKDKRNYNVADINDWGKPGKSQGIHIDKNNFNSFLQKIREGGYTTVSDFVVSEVHLKLLNLALVATLGTPLDTVCSKPGKVFITGDFIKFSDFVKSDGMMKSFCEFEVAFVEVIAFKVLFVDMHIRHCGLQLSIIAPRWEIIGTRRIGLDGSNGMDLPKAGSGREPGSRGDDGLPGRPGVPGGNFLGIGQNFMDGKDLTIQAWGGHGGRGQEGGDGKEGLQGRRAELSEEFGRYMIRDDKIIAVAYNEIIEKWMYWGKPGERGGDGGNGGRGGVGGVPGKVQIFRLDGMTDVPRTYIEPGMCGADGEGGKGGRGGKTGDDLTAHFCKRWAFFVPVEMEWCGDKEYSENYGRAESGKNGISGASGEPVPRAAYQPQSATVVITNFRIFLRKNSRDVFKITTLKEFERNLSIHFGM